MSVSTKNITLTVEMGNVPGTPAANAEANADENMDPIDEFKSHIDRIFLAIDEHEHIPRTIPNSELDSRIKDNAVMIVSAIRSYLFKGKTLDQIDGNDYRAIAIVMGHIVAIHDHRKYELEEIFDTITNEAFTDLPKFIRSLHEPMAGGARRTKKHRRRATKRTKKQKRNRRTRSRRRV